MVNFKGKPKEKPGLFSFPLLSPGSSGAGPELFRLLRRARALFEPTREKAVILPGNPKGVKI